MVVPSNREANKQNKKVLIVEIQMKIGEYYHLKIIKICITWFFEIKQKEVTINEKNSNDKIS